MWGEKKSTVTGGRRGHGCAKANFHTPYIFLGLV